MAVCMIMQPRNLVFQRNDEMQQSVRTGKTINTVVFEFHLLEVGIRHIGSKSLRQEGHGRADLGLQSNLSVNWMYTPIELESHPSCT